MVKLVEVIAKSLVENPDAVEVTEKAGKNSTMVIELQVAPEDMGKVIGKQGRIAKALRSVVKAAATKANKKVVVEIVQQTIYGIKYGTYIRDRYMCLYTMWGLL